MGRRDPTLRAAICRRFSTAETAPRSLRLDLWPKPLQIRLRVAKA